MMNVVGYCLIKDNPTSGLSPNPITEFVGKPIRVYEFARDDSVLVINNEATGLATFDKEDIISSFKCEMVGNVCVPPGLSFIDKTVYSTKVMTRKGGYNDTLMQMVIMTSLHSRKFNDDFLFQKQREESYYSTHTK